MVIYLVKIVIVLRLIAGSGWTPADIGYMLCRKGTGILAGSYVAGALLLVLLLELALGQVELDPDRLASMRGLYPDTTIKRLVFILYSFTRTFGNREGNPAPAPEGRGISAVARSDRYAAR